MSAFEAGAEIADTVRTSGVAVPANRLLVIALEGLATSDLSAVAHQSVFYRLPENPVTAQVPGSEEYRLAAPLRDHWLPFSDQDFDIVVLYRVTSQNVDIQLLLSEVGRVLRHDGVVVLVNHHSDFSFAPLPDGGSAHLLHRWLREADFAAVAFPPLAGARVVAVALSRSS